MLRRLLEKETSHARIFFDTRKIVIDNLAVEQCLTGPWSNSGGSKLTGQGKFISIYMVIALKNQNKKRRLYKSNLCRNTRLWMTPKLGVSGSSSPIWPCHNFGLILLYFSVLRFKFTNCRILVLLAHVIFHLHFDTYFYMCHSIDFLQCVKYDEWINVILSPFYVN